MMNKPEAQTKAKIEAEIHQRDVEVANLRAAELMQAVVDEFGINYDLGALVLRGALGSYIGNFAKPERIDGVIDEIARLMKQQAHGVVTIKITLQEAIREEGTKDRTSPDK